MTEPLTPPFHSNKRKNLLTDDVLGDDQVSLAQRRERYRSWLVGPSRHLTWRNPT